MLNALCPHYKNTKKALAAYNALSAETKKQNAPLKCLLFAAKYIQITATFPFVLCVIACTSSPETFGLSRFVYKNDDMDYAALTIIFLAALPIAYLSARFEDLIGYFLVTLANHDIVKLSQEQVSDV